MMAAIKSEGGEPFVKPDPEITSPNIGHEDDDYEDTGELEFPKQDTQAWLARIPQVLWDKWSTLNGDDEIQLGVVRHYKDSNQYKLILNPLLKQHSQLPTEFDMRVMDPNSRNTFVFSEKDLPGYKHKARPQGAQDDGKFRAGKSRRKQFYRSIPKQTTLAASISQEMHCVAAEDQEYGDLFKARMDAEANARRGIKFIDDDVGKTSAMVLPSSIGGGANAMTGFKTFISPLGGRGNKPKPQENKTARIPQNELLDRLYDLFKQYKYWPLKALKAELRQPETYLKETLQLIATLIKSGPFALTYKLKPESDLSLQDLAAKDEIAPNTGGAGVSDGEDDDEDLEMEDAI